MTAADTFRVAVEAALGCAPEIIEPGRLHRFGKKKAGWCKLFDDCLAGVFGDWSAGVGPETWTASERTAMTRQQRAALARQVEAAAREREAQQRQQWADNAKSIAKLWARCVPLTHGDPVALYLRRRGFGGVWPYPQCLRLHRALPYWTDDGKKLGEFPAMVAPLTQPNGRMVALHRTYLTVDGRKADVPTVKKVTGAAGPLAGACIPTSVQVHHPIGPVVGIAEGIETGLGAWLGSGIPTVAAYSAGNLAAWQWPSDARRVVIFADADRAGREAADTLRARAIAAGLRCEVLTPTDEGADWCDVWAQRGAVTVEGAGA